MSAAFATRLLAWHDVHGRHDLPWQHPRTPYRVWVSEIMLQQTRVSTVIAYFERFVAALPTLRALAAAPLDEVLAHWSGLGYYSRARNLHRAAQDCVKRHAGDLPRTFEELAALPGIGRSTAGAILAQAHGDRFAILDGNVRRVLSRHALVEGDSASAAVQKRLWELAQARLPKGRLADYAQAIMDLGATLCKTRNPRCDHCPLASDCAARITQRTHELPQKSRPRATPLRQTTMLVLCDPHGRVLLERRPPSGIWGGLWSLPEVTADAGSPDAVLTRLLLTASAHAVLPPFVHTFTHFKLAVQPLRIDVRAQTRAVADTEALRWVNAETRSTLGLPRSPHWAGRSRSPGGLRRRSC